MTYVRSLTGVGHLVLADMGGVSINLNDPAIETNLVVQLQMARQMWLATANRAARTRREAIKAGKYVGPTPLGFVRVNGALVEDPETGPIIRAAFELAASADLHHAVAFLRERLPQRRWDTDHVRRLLANRAYIGESRSGDIVNPDAHDPLDGLDATTWQAAQTDPRPRRANGDYPLSHAVHCGRCGDGLVGGLQTVKGRQYRRYRCSNPACKGGTSVRAERLEDHVRAEVKLALGKRQFRDQFAPEGEADAKVAWEAAKAERKALMAKVKPSHPEFETYLAEADAEIVRTGSAYAEIAKLARTHERLPEADQLDDPIRYAVALRAITSVVAIIVAPGRGAIEDRVIFRDLGDDVPRTLAA
jgi:recombinase-like zinc beta ribbon protein